MDTYSSVVANFVKVSSNIVGVEAYEIHVVDIFRELQLPHTNMGSKAHEFRVLDETRSQH